LNTIEQQIVKGLQAGDKKAIALLYDHYSPALYGVIKKILPDEALAKDALQESFVKYWKYADKYDPKKAKLFTWLITIARNTAIDKYRSVTKRGDKEIQMQDPFVNLFGGANYIKPELIDIRDQVGKLAPKYQQVIDALFFNGMTQQEASDELDIPLGTIKTRLRTGLQALRKLYSDGEDGLVKSLLGLMIILTLY